MARLCPTGAGAPGRVAIDTYDDHRMAMSFSLVSLGGVPVRINDPSCVAKTFPGFWALLEQLRDPSAGGTMVTAS